MLNTELQALENIPLLQLRAESVQSVDWIEVSDLVGGPMHVLLDYDQCAALATNEVPHETKASISMARDLGAISSFGMASDNPFVGALSGMRGYADYVFTPYLNRSRLVTKASSLFYERIIDELNVEPSSVVMVGHDPVRDIANAQRLGISTIQVPALGTLFQGLMRHRGRRLVRPVGRLGRVT